MNRFVVLLVLVLLFFMSIASAQNPDTILILSDHADTALIANNHDIATITVSVQEGETPVPDVEVTLSVVNSEMGAIYPSIVTTGPDGQAYATFTVKTQAGMAVIRAESSTPIPLISETTQKTLTPIPDEASYIQSITSLPDEWLIANGSDRATISVYAYNTSPISSYRYPLAGLQVQFSVNNTIFGTFRPVTAVTNSDGVAQSTFKTGYKSGTALLYGNLTYHVNNEPNQKSFELEQKIDHDTPYRIFSYQYNNRRDVGDIEPMVITFVDVWGNPVDNRRNTEEVEFTISSPNPLPKGAGFVDAEDNVVRSLAVPVDGQGYVTVDIRTDETPGWNIVVVRPLMYKPNGQKAIADRYLNIEGLPGEPVRIEAQFNPDNFMQVANNQDVFKVSYTLWDKFDNYVQNRSVHVETSIPGEEIIIGTNPQGLAMLTYGPKNSIGMIMITATAIDNSSVVHTQPVWFVSQEPDDMLFTANPQTMPSRDVPADMTVSLIATVVDVLGNPVANEIVNFGIQPESVTYDEPHYIITDEPEILVTSAITNQYGDAVVQFLPGGFTTDQSEDEPPLIYDPTATGRCTVTATWEDVTRSIPLVWKNYPYLSVESFASSSVVDQYDTVDITVLLKGDGWALRPAPIDAVLVIDVSGSMNDPLGSTTRLKAAQNAAKEFVGNMDMAPGRDRVALVTFSSDTTVVQALSSDKNAVNSSIDSMSAYSGTIMRKGYYEGIRHLKDNGRDNAIKAVILMTDGDWNLHGSPLAKGVGFPDTDPDQTVYNRDYENIYGIARSSYPWYGSGYSFDPPNCIIRNSASSADIRYEGYEWYSGLPNEKGTLSEEKYWQRRYPYSTPYPYKKGLICTDGQNTNQNMSVYALSGLENRHVKVYTLGFAQALDDNVEADLTTLSSATAGWYQWAGDEAALKNLYSAIVGELKVDAGVNTMLNLDYDTLEVNYVIEYNNEENPIFDYVYSVGHSTYLNSYFADGTSVDHSPPLPYTVDSSPSFSSSPKRIDLSLGTVRLNQIWEIKYRLQAQKLGLYNMFGPDSSITFNDGEQYLNMPDLYITVIEGYHDPTVTTHTLEYTDVSEVVAESGSGPIPLDLYKTFKIESVYTGKQEWVTENYYIITSDANRWLVGTRDLTFDEANEVRYFTIRISDLPLGWVSFDAEMIVFDAPAPYTLPERREISRHSIDSGDWYFKLE